MENFISMELLGFGAFGKVYKGRRRGTAEIVALKHIPKRGRSKKDFNLLYAEIDVMRSLQHPNIIRMIDTFETSDEIVVVTEFAEGDLHQIIEDDKTLPMNQVRIVARQLIDALQYLHANRIMHRDMKPQNILIGKGGVVKLCDFGFARAMSVNTLVLTSIKGTPLYMSPELMNEQPYDHTSDLWSLGCILYEIAVGQPPFYTSNLFQLIKLIVRNPVQWPTPLDTQFMDFVEGLLIKEPGNRLAWPAAAEHPFLASQPTQPHHSPPLQHQPQPNHQQQHHLQQHHQHQQQQQQQQQQQKQQQQLQQQQKQQHQHQQQQQQQQHHHHHQRKKNNDELTPTPTPHTSDTTSQRHVTESSASLHKPTQSQSQSQLQVQSQSQSSRSQSLSHSHPRASSHTPPPTTIEVEPTADTRPVVSVSSRSHPDNVSTSQIHTPTPTHTPTPAHAPTTSFTLPTTKHTSQSTLTHGNKLTASKMSTDSLEFSTQHANLQPATVTTIETETHTPPIAHTYTQHSTPIATPTHEDGNNTNTKNNNNDNNIVIANNNTDNNTNQTPHDPKPTAMSIRHELQYLVESTTEDAEDAEQVCLRVRADVGILEMLKTVILQASRNSELQKDHEILLVALKLIFNILSHTSGVGNLDSFLDGPALIEALGVIVRCLVSKLENPASKADVNAESDVVMDLVHLSLCVQFAALSNGDAADPVAEQVARNILPLLSSLLSCGDQGVYAITLECCEALFQRLSTSASAYETTWKHLVPVASVQAIAKALAPEGAAKGEIIAESVSVASELATRVLASMIHFANSTTVVLPIDRAIDRVDAKAAPSVAEPRATVACVIGVNGAMFPKSMEALFYQMRHRDTCAFALQVVLHTLRHCDTTAQEVSRSKSWLSSLVALTLDDDTDVLTMALLSLVAIVDAFISHSDKQPHTKGLRRSHLIKLVSTASVQNAAAAALVLARGGGGDDGGGGVGGEGGGGGGGVGGARGGGGGDGELGVSKWIPSEISDIVTALPSLFDNEAISEGFEFGFRQGFGRDVMVCGLLDGVLGILALLSSSNGNTDNGNNGDDNNNNNNNNNNTPDNNNGNNNSNTATMQMILDAGLMEKVVRAIETMISTDKHHPPTSTAPSTSPTSPSSPLSHQMIYLISPRGTEAAMLFLHRCFVDGGGEDGVRWGLVLRVTALASFLLGDDHMSELQSWSRGPQEQPPAAVTGVVLSVVRLLLGLLLLPLDKSQRNKLNTLFFEVEMVRKLVVVCHVCFRTHRIHLQAPFGLAMRLAMQTPKLSRQLITTLESFGPALGSLLDSVLKPSHPLQGCDIELIIDTTEAFAHIARASDEFYPSLLRMKLLGYLTRLLASSIAPIRARACNTIGNLFRHSEFFYDEFSRGGGVDLLVECVSDADANTQKFACFALGNLLFHKDQFYPKMTKAIPLLLRTLTSSSSSSSTTTAPAPFSTTTTPPPSSSSPTSMQLTANAIGALGNMARNSSLLDTELALNNAPSVVLDVMVNNVSSPSLAAVSLFALSSFAKHRRCCALLKVWTHINTKNH